MTTMAAKDNARLLWLALSMTSGIGPTRVRKLLTYFDHNLERIFHASLTELEASGLQASSAQALFDGKSAAAAEEEFGKAASVGARILTPDDDLWPQRLNEIYDPPIVLYVRGDATVLTQPAIAVVGTRHPTPYGMGMAGRLSQDLAAQGLGILSGMARGVDTLAHKGALAARGNTIAVWGTGIDVPYPKENKKLSDEIVAGGGAILTEFAVGTFAAPQNFPIRNRLISGLSVGVLVIEGAEYSGTRITARCALEQNREVFAVPGNVTNKQAWGPNTLIKQGAKLTATWEDVWEDLPTDVRLAVEDRREARRQDEDESNPGQPASLFEATPRGRQQFSPLEKRLLTVIRPDEAIQIDELIEKVEQHMSPSEVFAVLFELELVGTIRQLPGRNYVRSF
ncbi:MAG: DNA-processing protein DprA [Acidobacteriaceae bacterium]